jgi:hypothetical protein
MTLTGVLPPGGRLNLEDDVISNNGRYQLILQRDGNLVLYDRSAGSRPLWSTQTQGQAVHECVMERDGNLVIYGLPKQIWASQTQGHPNSFLCVQDDGNVVIVPPGSSIWATNTTVQS